MIGYLATNHALIAAFAPRPVRRTRGETIALNRVFKMAPKLSDYFGDGEILATKGNLDRPISGLVIDSRRVAPGNLFFALPGLRADGAMFIDEAMSRGAVAVVTEQMPAHPPAKVTFIQVADARAALARVAQRFFKFPDRDMTVVGVTGTNGKTTVSHLIKHFLSGDQRIGLIGSIHYEILHAVLIDRVGIAHEHDGGCCIFFSEITHQLQCCFHRCAGCEGAECGCLNGWAICHRVGEGHAQFDDIGTGGGE